MIAASESHFLTVAPQLRPGSRAVSGAESAFAIRSQMGSLTLPGSDGRGCDFRHFNGFPQSSRDVLRFEASWVAHAYWLGRG